MNARPTFDPKWQFQACNDLPEQTGRNANFRSRGGTISTEEYSFFPPPPSFSLSPGGRKSVPLLENFKGIMESIGSSLLSHRGEIQSCRPFVPNRPPTPPPLTLASTELQSRSISYVIFLDGPAITAGENT